MAKGYSVGILITGDGSGGQKAIKLTEEQLEALNKRARDTEGFKQWEADINKMALAAAKWAAGAAVAAAGVAAAMVKSAIDSADATGILAGKLGVTTEALSKLQYAAKLSDVEQSRLEIGLKRLTVTLTDAANNTGEAVRAFEALGLSAQALIELPADEQLGAIADALNGVDNASQKAALAQKIFGDAGADLLPLLAEGSAGIRAFGVEAERMGVVISGEMAAKSAQFNDSVDRIKAAVSGLGLEMASFVVGPLANFTEGLLAAFKGPALGDIERINHALAGLRGQLAGMEAGRMGGTAQAQAIREQITAMEELLRKSEEHVRMLEIAGLKEIMVTARRKDALTEMTAAQRAATDAALDMMFARERSIDVETRHVAVTKTATKARWDYREANMEAILTEENAARAAQASAAAVQTQTLAMAASAEQADPWADAITGAVERVDSAFVDMWKNIGSGFDAFAASLKDAFSQLLAELAHLAITRPILVSIDAVIGGALGGSSAASAAGGASSLLSKIPGIGPAFAPGGLAPFLGQWGVNSGILTQTYGAGGMGPPATSFSWSGLGLNLGAGLAGGYLADAIYGGRDASGYGATIGGLAGSYFGPIGTGAGALIGGLLDSALGGSDPSGKRVKLGILTGAGAAGQEDYRTFASGLQVGNITRRADDYLSDEQVRQYLDAFGVMDSALTAIARGAGASVDFSGVTLAGQRQPYDGGMTPEGFFGSMAKGEVRSTLADAPAEFVRQWLAEIDEQLSARVKGLLGDTAGKTADALIELFGLAADLDRLLNIDVLEAAAEQATQASRTILDAYGDTTEAVVSLAQQFDGSSAGLRSLTEALAGQKEVAAALAQQYLELSGAVSAQFGDTIASIRESVLDDAQLYALRREQIGTLTGELAATVDPSRIAELTARIDTLARGAWGLLDEAQQGTMVDEFVGFLEDARALAQDQIAKGQESLAARERAIVEAVDLDVLRAAAATQDSAANTMAGAAATFAAWVSALPSSIAVITQAPAEVNA